MSLHTFSGKQQNQRLFWRRTNRLPDSSRQSYSTIFVECMRLCAAVQLCIRTYRWFSEHSSWLSLATKLKVTEKIRLKISEDVQTTHIEVQTSSSDVADEVQFLFAPADGESETEKQLPERKNQSRKMAPECVAHEEPSSRKSSIKEFTKIDRNTTSHSIHGVKANARMPVEKDVALVLKNLKLKKFGQPNDVVLLTTDKRFQHYEVNEDRIILKDGLLFPKCYGETGNIKYYQLLIPKTLIDEVLRNLHGELRKHPGNTKTIIACRQKYYYPNMAKLTRQWATSCEQRIWK